MFTKNMVGFLYLISGAVPAVAQQAQGLHVEMTAGYDAFTSHDNYEDIPDTLDGVRLGGAVGYDVAVTDHLLLGVEAGFGFSLGDEKSALFTRDKLTLSTGRDLDISLRAATQITKRTAVYLKAGYANSQVSQRLDSRIGPIYDTAHSSSNGDGLRLGAGLEHALSRHIFLKSEYRWTRYFGHFVYQQRPTRSQVLAGLGLRF